jgi:hypothetical protein
VPVLVAVSPLAHLPLQVGSGAHGAGSGLPGSVQIIGAPSLWEVDLERGKRHIVSKTRQSTGNVTWCLSLSRGGGQDCTSKGDREDTNLKKTSDISRLTVVTKYGL